MGSCPEELYSLPACSFFLDPYFKGMECRVQYCTAVFQSSQSSKEHDERSDQGLAGYCHPWPKPPHGAFVHCLIR